MTSKILRNPLCSQAVLGPGGILASERCIAAHVDLARQHGAEVRLEEQVLSWHAEADGVVVRSDKGEYRARKLVLAGGSWMPQLVPELQVVTSHLSAIQCAFCRSDLSIHAHLFLAYRISKKKHRGVQVYLASKRYFNAICQLYFKSSGCFLVLHNAAFIILKIYLHWL